MILLDVLATSHKTAGNIVAAFTCTHYTTPEQLLLLLRVCLVFRYPAWDRNEGFRFRNRKNTRRWTLNLFSNPEESLSQGRMW